MSAWTPEWKVTLNGGLDYTDLTLTNLTITSGRTDIYSQPSAGYCSVTIVNTDGSSIPLDINDDVLIQVKDSSGSFVNLFGGTITDLDITVDKSGANGIVELETDSQYENLAAFRFALRKFLRFSEDAAGEAGLTPQQHQALLAIKGFPGRDRVTVGELAERLQIKHHSAVGLIDRLVLENLVERDASAEDRRQVHISLTVRGESMLEELSSMHREQLRQIGPELSALLQRLGQGDAGT